MRKAIAGGLVVVGIGVVCLIWVNPDPHRWIIFYVVGVATAATGILLWPRRR